MSKALLGIDVGGSSVRAVVREIESGQVTVVKRSMTPKALFTIGEFGYGMDTEVIFSIVCDAVKECLSKSGCAGSDVAALSTSVLRHTLVALDKDGKVLFSSPNRDARAVDATMRLGDTFADEIYALSGHRPMPNLTACKLLWLKETQPELYADIRYAFTLQDYLNYRFTGKIFAERSNAGETMLYDLKASAWSDAMIAKLGLERSVFPELIDAGVNIGSLTDEAADALGLASTVTVVTGAGDTQSALLGMGVIDNGGIAVVAGTTAPVQMITDQPVIDEKQRLWTGVAGVPGKYVLESNAGGMGISLEWIAGLLFGSNPNPEAALMAAASKTGAGAGGMLSTVGAQIFNNSVLSLPIEQTIFSTTNYIPNAEQDCGKAARAVVEGMAFSLRGNIGQIEEVSGLSVNEIKLGGGMSRGAVFAEVISEVTGKPVIVPEIGDASAMGAVISAAVGAGICADYKAATGTFAKLREPVAAQDVNETYERMYDDWSEMYKTSTDNLMQLGALINELRQDADGAGAQDGAENVSLRIYADADLSEDAVKMLGEFGTVTYKSYRDGEMLEGDDMISTLKDYDVFITEVDIVDAAIIKELPNLRMIGVCRGNPTNIDVDACTAAGIPVVYTPGRNSEAVADMAVAFILNIARMIPESAAFLKEDGEAGDMGRQGAAYFRYQGMELWRANIGIVGGGAIGRKVAKRLLGFDANLFVYDPYLSAEDAALMGAKKVELDELLAVSDVVTLHAPVTPETTNMINAASFEKMKDGVLVVNTARAALMDYDALLVALKSGKVKGAALDVFPAEPPASNDPLVLMPNVLSTPHTAGNTKQVGIHQGLIMVENIKKLMAGELSSDVVNRKSFKTFSFTGDKKFDADALELLKDNVVGVNDLDTKKKETVPAPSAAKAAEPAPAVKIVEAPKAAAPTGGYAQYMALIAEFLKNMSNDADVKAKTAGKEISFQITFKENEESCYLYFNKGDIDAALGAFPHGTAEVNLRMPIEIFDGMMVGTVNGAQAAMTGKMSFTGNVRKAMSMQSILKLMMGSYQAAIATVGKVDVAALSAAAAPAAPVASDTPVAAPAAPAAVAPRSGEGYAKYMALIKEFLNVLSNDAEVKSKTAGKDISFQITFKDNEESCYMYFNKGNIEADLGEFASGAEVNLRMPIEIFDGMMLGTVNGPQAAMTGKMSFTGNVRKAMSMQSILKLMMGSYQAAIAKVGKVDIASLGEEAPAPAAAAPAGATVPTATAVAAAVPAGITIPQPEVQKQGFLAKLFGKQQPVVQQVIVQQAAPAAAPAVVVSAPEKPKTGDVRDEILLITTEMYHKGLITGIGGNISARCDDNPDHIWITPSSIFKGDLRADQMVRIDMEGNVAGQTELSASSEKNVHTAIYKSRPDITAVIHSHATKSTLMGLAGLKFEPISSDAAFFGEVPVVPFLIPGSPELGDLVAEAIGEEKCAAIMQNHGLVVAGTSLRRASDMTDCVEITAAKILEGKAMGVELAVIPPEAQEELAELGKMLI
ncbi:MAG: FGGY family carbohydrate kinase [Oscillospiraceae bacterium]|nr:FGGY family carbohydrate kinase [Oscillospiraceae bacterium]